MNKYEQYLWYKYKEEQFKNVPFMPADKDICVIQFRIPKGRRYKTDVITGHQQWEQYDTDLENGPRNIWYDALPLKECYSLNSKGYNDAALFVNEHDANNFLDMLFSEGMLDDTGLKSTDFRVMYLWDALKARIVDSLNKRINA